MQLAQAGNEGSLGLDTSAFKCIFQINLFPSSASGNSCSFPECVSEGFSFMSIWCGNTCSQPVELPVRCFLSMFFMFMLVQVYLWSWWFMFSCFMSMVVHVPIFSCPCWFVSMYSISWWFMFKFSRFIIMAVQVHVFSSSWWFRSSF